ncbi:MAG: hypothetical protein ACOX8I_07050 [Bacillota bacterium]
MATLEVAPDLRKRGRAARIIRAFLKFLVIGMAFAAFLIGGLLIAEESVNNLMGRATERTIFNIGKSSDGYLEITLLGERYPGPSVNLGPFITGTLQTWKTRITGLAARLGDGWQSISKKALSWCETLHLLPAPEGESEGALK